MTTDYAVFILSNRRADRVYTIPTLREHGYTGKIYIVIDDEDPTAEAYYKNFGEDVLMFCKEDIEKNYDTGDNWCEKRVVFHARNAVWDLAEKLGYKYFITMDDDYKAFGCRRERNGQLLEFPLHGLDKVFSLFFDFLEVSGARTVCMAQGGDFIGGCESTAWKEKLLRKAMNVFFFKTDRRFPFVGRVNEDVNTYTYFANKGELFFTYCEVLVHQETTQANEGGMSGLYLDMGTYLKSFYSVMYSPQAVKIAQMGSGHTRIHHHVTWEKCAPKIIGEKYRKGV